jgi:hypothetical protein
LPKKRKPGLENLAGWNFETRLATGPRQSARASGRKTGVGHGTVPPEPQRGMAGNGAAEVRRVPGSLVKSPPVSTLGGTLRSDPVPDPPESLQRPRAHTRRASANANARAHSTGPAFKAISRSTSALWRTTGATWPGKIADAGSNAALRLCETRKKRASMSRFLLSEYRLHTGGASLCRQQLSRAANAFSRRPQLHRRLTPAQPVPACLLEQALKIVRPAHQQRARSRTSGENFRDVV